MSVYNNEGWKWALCTFHDPSRHETRSLPTCTRAMMQTWENTVAINNSTIDVKIWTPKLLYYFLKCIKSAMKILCHGWNVRNGKNKNLWNKSNKEKKSPNRDFQTYHGPLHTHWWRRVTWYAWNMWMGTFTTARHALTQEKHASLGCHHCLLAHDFTQFGDYQWSR